MPKQDGRGGGRFYTSSRESSTQFSALPFILGIIRIYLPDKQSRSSLLCLSDFLRVAGKVGHNGQFVLDNWILRRSSDAATTIREKI